MKHSIFSKARCVPLLLAASLSAGCASITGLSGSAEYGCKAPSGVRCDSVSGTYYNALQNNLPSQQPARKSDGSSSVIPDRPQPAPLRTDAAAATASAAPMVAALPLRAQPRVLRLWYKPWEDADRDLYDQGYVYVQVDNGRWLIDHAQQRIRDAYAPLRPPALLSQQAAQSDRPPAASVLNGKPAGSQPSPLPLPSPSWPGAPLLTAGDNQ
ncbi:TraV family lipoprotein [Noviherbaspirillum sedimenti]|uniref:Conjugal transfer protein TraV n=1 Tax=Noviherbaspirillum sedimenti TaxID=2320865 RepID=A0A3A3FYY4_9BURK|nr:TraV family lipoprotein [Noviherbaspirillum sedimenti]RJG00565.1 conjugal transfer protein TraV [Noviherbaspirillum sedimenti]